MGAAGRIDLARRLMDYDSLDGVDGENGTGLDEWTSFYLAIGMTVCGHILINAASNMINYSHHQSVPATSKWLDPSRLKTAGWILFIVGNLLCFAAFAFAAQTMLSAFGSIQFITNVFFVYLATGDKPTRRQILGTLLVIGGNLTVVKAATKTNKVYNAKELQEMFFDVVYLSYLGASLVSSGLLYLFYFWLEKLYRQTLPNVMSPEDMNMVYPRISISAGGTAPQYSRYQSDASLSQIKIQPFGPDIPNPHSALMDHRKVPIVPSEKTLAPAEQRPNRLAVPGVGPPEQQQAPSQQQSLPSNLIGAVQLTPVSSPSDRTPIVGSPKLGAGVASVSLPLSSHGSWRRLPSPIEETIEEEITADDVVRPTDPAGGRQPSRRLPSPKLSRSPPTHSMILAGTPSTIPSHSASPSLLRLPGAADKTASPPSQVAKITAPMTPLSRTTATDQRATSSLEKKSLVLKEKIYSRRREYSGLSRDRLTTDRKHLLPPKPPPDSKQRRFFKRNLHIFRPVVYACAAALVGTHAVVYGKGMSSVVVALFKGHQVWKDWFSIVLVLLWAAFISHWLIRMNTALKRFEAALVIPILQVFWIIGCIATGGVYYREFAEFNVPRWLMFWGGIVLVGFGVCCLAPVREPPPRPAATGKLVPPHHRYDTDIQEVRKRWKWSRISRGSIAQRIGSIHRVSLGSPPIRSISVSGASPGPPRSPGVTYPESGSLARMESGVAPTDESHRVSPSKDLQTGHGYGSTTNP